MIVRLQICPINTMSGGVNLNHDKYDRELQETSIGLDNGIMTMGIRLVTLYFGTTSNNKILSKRSGSEGHLYNMII